MEFELIFTFRGLPYCCTGYIDASAEPCYVFIQLQDEGLIKEFGTEVTIKTDMQSCLSRRDDFIGDLRNLRLSIFDALKDHPHFRGARRERYMKKVFPFPKPQPRI